MRLLNYFARNRFYIQLVLSIAVYLALNFYLISLWWLVVGGTLLGILWGKVFCRWICPVGLLMELLMKMSGDLSLKNMYQYHKLGCPIAWISGLLNSISLFQITKNEQTCKNCGLCDKVCYMTVIDPQQFSLYKSRMKNPAQNFSCSKCLICVEKCPNGSLSFKPTLYFDRIKN